MAPENITDYLFDYARSNPNKPALLYPERITFGELCHLTEKYAAGFQKNGIIRGMKTIVLVKPGLDLFAVTYALLRIGAIPVMIDPGMGVKAMVNALKKAQAKAFVGTPRAHLLRVFFSVLFKPVAVKVSTGRTLFWKTGRLEDFRKKKCITCEVFKADPNDEVAVFFTSGSTGPAKGVVYKNYMLEAQIRFMRDHFHFRPEDTDLCTFPLIGLLVICHGLSVVMADMDMTKPGKLNPRKLFQNINQFSCSSMFCSPMVLQKLATHGKENNLKLLSLKKVFTAGAPVSPSLLRNFKNLLLPDSVIHTPFGSTEALSVTDIVDSELFSVYGESPYYFKGICVGRPLNGIGLKIIKITDGPIKNMEDAEKLGVGSVGEIIVYGPNVTQGYLANDLADKLSKIIDPGQPLLWHRTGDLGKLDDNGKVWYYGRKSQRVEVGNETLFTIPCEAVFNFHSGVSRSALVGVQINGRKTPVICIELEKGVKKSERLTRELQYLAKGNEKTRQISIFLFHKKFPVDPRHNAKIFREKLAVWAQNQLK
ncbi:MAG: fatty acid CoA ligase family protein [Bacteroides sp.]|jgi:acyl-coenzyme A synthetase/AMP-(fatty) acid ligase|nr:fatty acid CoA ligase family protein [Bacteroides sp.]